MKIISVVDLLFKLSSSLQTMLINYMEFRSVEPKFSEPSDYTQLYRRPEAREEPPVPFQKEDSLAPHFTILLEVARMEGRHIKPVNRRYEPLRTKATSCRKCHAPPEYLRNHGFYRPKKSDKIYPRHTCKVCYAEYAPGAGRHKPKHICPYCGYAMNPKTYRTNFRVYMCEQDTCKHRDIHPQGNRYSEKDWLFDYETLSCALPPGKKRLTRIKNMNLLDLEMSLYVECGMTTREVVNIMKKLYGDNIMRSHQTVLNHAEALATHIAENEEKLPIPVSDMVCEDETYVRYAGKWGYLFRAFNPQTKGILAEHFSHHRDTKGCITLNKEVINTYLKNKRDPCFKLIADRAPIYGATVQYLQQRGKAQIELHQVKGIFDEPGELNSAYRPQKQAIERSFESLKSEIKRRRNFAQFSGAQRFCFLHKIYYNHLRKHTALDGDPPVPLYLRSGKRVTNWNELLQYLSEKQP